MKVFTFESDSADQTLIDQLTPFTCAIVAGVMYAPHFRHSLEAMRAKPVRVTVEVYDSIEERNGACTVQDSKTYGTVSQGIPAADDDYQQLSACIE